MPIDANIITQGKTYTPDIPGLFNQAVQTRNELEKGRLYQEKTQEAQLQNASNRLTAMDNLLAGVRDQRSYGMAKQQLERLGIIKPGEVPDAYDPDFVDMHRNNVAASKERLNQLLTAANIDKTQADAIRTRMGGDQPALIQIVDAYEKAAPERRQAMDRFGKVFSKDTYIDPNNNLSPLPGAPETRRQLKSAEGEGAQLGKEEGEAKAHLADLEAYAPELSQTVGELRDLGKVATYTQAGKVYNYVGRQLGAEPKAGAVAREQYISTVQDTLLPLLRQTFGAQFTEAEGKRLLTTMGDPDKSPKEKEAALDSLVTQKSRQIKSARRRVGADTEADLPIKEAPNKTVTTPEGVKFLGYE